MEGMGHGKPIIATTVGGIPEVIIDADNGLLVPAADSDALANALIKLLNDPTLYEKIGQNARKTYEKLFTVQRMLKETEKVYSSF